MTDVLIIGGGIAGLYAALHIDPKLEVLVVTKESVDISNSWLAQGGIAAAISKEDTPAEHYEDTLTAGAGLCDPEAVKMLVDEGPRDIAELVEMRVPFDLNEDGDLAITREGGHHRNRIVHAGGDATGRETVKVLAHIALSRSNITFRDNTLFIDIIAEGGRAVGALLCRGSEVYAQPAGSVVLCTGGIGQIFSHSTNPSVATGDGIGACVRAGVRLSGMEFIQFHPTSLYDPARTGRSFLISEAVRGEGGRLVNSKGERFMEGRHPLAELAPRDIVARGITSELAESGESCVYIDITAKPRDLLERRFPTIFRECMNRGIDISRDRIPVIPAQHYMVGGIAADLWSRTSMPGLYAVGEAASTGVHGANRLASNSMLECLVFGRRAALDISGVGRRSRPIEAPGEGAAQVGFDAPAAKTLVRSACDRYANVVRTGKGLEDGMEDMKALLAELDTAGGFGKEFWEARNMATTALEVFKAALARTESVGTHYRED